MNMNDFWSFEMIACITFTTPALWAPFDSMCSINLEKFENSSHDGRNTIICGTFESLLFGDIVMIEFLAISRAAINSVFFVLNFYIQTDFKSFMDKLENVYNFHYHIWIYSQHINKQRIQDVWKCVWTPNECFVWLFIWFDFSIVGNRTSLVIWVFALTTNVKIHCQFGQTWVGAR